MTIRDEHRKAVDELEVDMQYGGRKEMEETLARNFPLPPEGWAERAAEKIAYLVGKYGDPTKEQERITDIITAAYKGEL